jgi:hypothetical protein
VCLAFLRLNISCSSVAMHWSTVNVLVNDIDTMFVKHWFDSMLLLG